MRLMTFRMSSVHNFFYYYHRLWIYFALHHELSARRSTIDGKILGLDVFFFTHSSSRASRRPSSGAISPSLPPHFYRHHSPIHLKGVDCWNADQSRCDMSQIEAPPPRHPRGWIDMTSESGWYTREREPREVARHDEHSDFYFIFMWDYGKGLQNWERMGKKSRFRHMHIDWGICVCFSLFFFLFLPVGLYLPRPPCLAFTAGLFPVCSHTFLFCWMGWLARSSALTGSAWPGSRMSYQRRDSLRDYVGLVFLYCLNRCTRLLDECEREGRKHGCSGRVEHWAGLRTLIEDTPTGFLPFYPLRLYSIYKKGRRASYTAQGKQ